MKTLTRPYILRVSVGFCTDSHGTRHDVCKVEQIPNREAEQPLNVFDRSGFYHLPLSTFIKNNFIDLWDKECHLYIYNTKDFSFADGFLYD